MLRRFFFFILFLLLILVISCTQPLPIDQKSAATDAEKTAIAEESAAIGPSGCRTTAECMPYCVENIKECIGFCSSNGEACKQLGIELPKGIPGYPCNADSECIGGLACTKGECSPPFPGAAGTGASGMPPSRPDLPQGCDSMESCSRYCADPANKDECLALCDRMPGLCANLNEIRASAAPPECKSCTACMEKSCILDCTFNCYSYTPIEEPNPEASKQGMAFTRIYREPIKAVWEPGPAYNRIGVTYFIDDYKALGVNTYSITPRYDHKAGSLTHSVDHATGEKADKEKIANIIKAKKAGLQVVLVAHDLYDLFPDANSNRGEKIRHEDYLDDVEATALKWAKVAEEYQVEYFVPVNEFEYVLYENGYSAEEACKITNELYKKVIPKVRDAFKGKIYCRVGGMDAKFGCMDFTPCDIFGFTYGFSGSNYKANFDKLFSAGEEASAKSGKKYIMAEAFSFNKDGMQACINLHQAGIASYKEKAKNGAGYTFMGLVQNNPIQKNDCPILGTRLVQDYKDFFGWMDGME